MGKERGEFVPETVCMGTATLNEKGQIGLRSQKLFLDLIHDGIRRREIPGELYLEPHLAPAPYLSIEILSLNPRDATIIKLQKERYAGALRQWDREGMNDITIEDFRKKYLNERILIFSSGSDRRRLHSVNLAQSKANRPGRQK